MGQFSGRFLQFKWANDIHRLQKLHAGLSKFADRYDFVAIKTSIE